MTAIRCAYPQKAEQHNRAKYKLDHERCFHVCILPEIRYHSPMRIFFRKLHRWLGLIMALQIIAWMVSGLYFSIYPITEIRGEHLTREPQNPTVEQLEALGASSEIRRLLEQHFGGDWRLSGMKLISVNGQAFWRVEGISGNEPFARLIHPDGKGVVPRLGKQEAGRRARDWLLEPAEPDSVDWVDSTSEGAEFRGRALPVWKVAFDQPESLVLYIDPWTGELLARRTDRWRIFDFLWMLHIMDFDTRDDFNHPLLQVSALLGLLIALSGVIFWALTTRLFRRRQDFTAKAGP